MIQDGVYLNTGDPLRPFDQDEREYFMTSQTRQEIKDDVKEVRLTDSTLSWGKPSTWGSGQQCCDGFNSYLPDTLRFEDANAG